MSKNHNFANILLILMDVCKFWCVVQIKSKRILNMKIELKLITGGTIILDTTDRMDLDKLHVALTEAFLVYWQETKGNTNETLARLDKEIHNVIGQLKGLDKDNILFNHIWQVQQKSITDLINRIGDEEMEELSQVLVAVHPQLDKPN